MSLHLLCWLQCEKQEEMIHKLLSQDEEGLKVRQMMMAVLCWCNVWKCIYSTARPLCVVYSVPSVIVQWFTCTHFMLVMR